MNNNNEYKGFYLYNFEGKIHITEGDFVSYTEYHGYKNTIDESLSYIDAIISNRQSATHVSDDSLPDFGVITMHLRRAGITTISQLHIITEEDLLSIRYFKDHPKNYLKLQDMINSNRFELSKEYIKISSIYFYSDKSYPGVYAGVIFENGIKMTFNWSSYYKKNTWRRRITDDTYIVFNEYVHPVDRKMICGHLFDR